MLQSNNLAHDDFDLHSNWSPRSNPLVTKLARFVPLDPQDVAAIEAICCEPIELPADHVIIPEGGRPDHVCLIVEGFAYRYKFLAGGRRQILGYVVPGDFCDVHFAVFDLLDHSVASLGRAKVVNLPIAALNALIEAHPKIERALALAALVDRSILHEWLLNIGQRNAFQKLSHLFCELSVRLAAINLINSDGSLELPLNQTALADSTGLTLVHINRTLQRMRCEGLIELRRHRLTILDLARLAAIADFEDNYLALQVTAD